MQCLAEGNFRFKTDFTIHFSIIKFGTIFQMQINETHSRSWDNFIFWHTYDLDFEYYLHTVKHYVAENVSGILDPHVWLETNGLIHATRESASPCPLLHYKDILIRARSLWNLHPLYVSRTCKVKGTPRKGLERAFVHWKSYRELSIVRKMDRWLLVRRGRNKRNYPRLTLFVS